MSVRRSFTSLQNQTNDDDDDDRQQQYFQQRIHNQNHDSADTTSRPLSLYDNLTALVASLKPPNLNTSSVASDIAGTSNYQPYQQHSEIVNSNNNNNNINNVNNHYTSNQSLRPNSSCSGSDHLIKVSKEDFIFSDIKFEFPELSPATSQSRLNQNYSLVNSVINKINNNNDNELNSLMNELLLNDVTRNQTMTSTIAPPSQPNVTGVTPTPQYVNIDESFLKKPAISDAKSSFFGLNGAGGGSDDNDSSLRPLLDHNHDDSGDGNTTVRSEIFQSPPSTTTINNYRRMMNDNQHSNINGNRVNNNNSTAVTNDESATQTAAAYDKLRCKMESPHKSVTYGPSTEGYNDYENKPSQAVYMSTTVPQNIKGLNIAGRHTPTRNSLRHSRMLVISKNFQGGYIKSNPMHLQCPGLAKFLLALQILCGILLTSIGLWILLWAPNTRTRDIPYWSGIPLVVAGTIGLILLDYKRAPRHRLREYFFKVLKINSLIFSLVAGCLVVVACYYASEHLHNLAHAERDCRPAKLFTAGSDCICRFGSRTQTTDHKRIQNPEKLGYPVIEESYDFHYRDLNCNEVKDAWRYILLASAILSVIGFLAVLSYLILFGFKRSKRKFPAAMMVQTSNI